MDSGLSDEEWYNPEIRLSAFSIQPFDLALNRAIYRAMTGISPAVEMPLHTASEAPLVNSPWLAAVGGCWMFNGEARRVIDEVAWAGDIRWLPLVIETPSGLVDDFQIIAPPLDGGDFLLEARTTRDPRGQPIRWVLDAEKLGARQVLMVPGITVAGLVMRGSILRKLLELGVQGVEVRKARVEYPA